ALRDSIKYHKDKGNEHRNKTKSPGARASYGDIRAARGSVPAAASQAGRVADRYTAAIALNPGSNISHTQAAQAHRAAASQLERTAREQKGNVVGERAKALLDHHNALAKQHSIAAGKIKAGAKPTYGAEDFQKRLGITPETVKALAS